VKQSSGIIWPYAIGISIILIFGACVGTIVVASKLPVEKSDTYMMGYHEADAKANELINARIAFNKKYKIEYINNGISVDATRLEYKLTDINNNPIDNAEIIAVFTRPNKLEFDQKLNKFSVENGVYTFENVTLPLEGRWDIMAKVTIGENQRFYNVKADTREQKFSEY